MIIFLLGYFVMDLLYLVWRMVYRVLFQKSSPDPILAIKSEFAKLYAHYRQIIMSNPVKIKIIAAIITCYFISTLMPLEFEIAYLIDYAASVAIYLLIVIIYAPKKNPLSKEFPIEIFGFIYSILMMYGCAGEFVITLFETNNSFGEDTWIYGYILILISYAICIATLSNFMERNLSRPEIIFVGMIMMTILEFMTYYGVGFCGGMEFYDPQTFESGIWEGIVSIVNRGIFIASQSQILERSTKEVCGYIILNGTDVLTVTAVLGYVLQRFMGIDSNVK
ncbi:MAG: hypothetical protein IKN27_13855 [Selenomonadaceae bacterium]|nr:hypothetical protein [Selenomonadaceae bacterium]